MDASRPRVDQEYNNLSINDIDIDLVDHPLLPQAQFEYLINDLSQSGVINNDQTFDDVLQNVLTPQLNNQPSDLTLIDELINKLSNEERIKESRMNNLQVQEHFEIAANQIGESSTADLPTTNNVTSESHLNVAAISEISQAEVNAVLDELCTASVSNTAQEYDELVYCAVNDSTLPTEEANMNGLPAVENESLVSNLQAQGTSAVAAINELSGDSIMCDNYNPVQRGAAKRPRTEEPMESTPKRMKLQMIYRNALVNVTVHPACFNGNSSVIVQLRASESGEMILEPANEPAVLVPILESAAVSAQAPAASAQAPAASAQAPAASAQAPAAAPAVWQRQPRTVFTKAQKSGLLAAFAVYGKHTPAWLFTKLAKQLGLKRTVVRTWFMNHKAKLKKEG